MTKKKFNSKKIVNFMLLAGKVKKVQRTGWIREGMPEPETVAEHTYRVAILARILAEKLRLNPDKLVSMAIFHDLAEGILGDPVTQRGKKQVSQHDDQKEIQLMKKIFTDLGRKDFFKYWKEHVLENSHKKTRYSDLLYQVGKIATAWQALEYELEGAPARRLDEFWANAWAHVSHPFLKDLLKELEKKRKKS